MYKSKIKEIFNLFDFTAILRFSWKWKIILENRIINFAYKTELICAYKVDIKQLHYSQFME